MSFKDSFKDIGGGQYLSAEDKETLASTGTEFAITEVIEDQANKYGPRYVLKVVVPDGILEPTDAESRNMAFQIGTVESRDRMLQQMEAYLEGDDAEDVPATLEKVGRSWVLRLV